MAANLGNVQSTNSITSSFKAFNSLNSLFSRINGVFGLCVVYLTTSVSYCLYNVYKAYQLRGHASFGLDDDFKLIKCQALLDEAQEKKSEGGQLLLQTCESLLLSITDTMLHDKERLLLELAQCYVEQDPDHSYQIAQRLSLSYNLFDIAQAIQTKRLDFDSAKLDALFTRAFKAKGEEEKQAPSSSSKQASHLLKFAQAFLLVKNNELASRCASNAFDLAKSFENNLDQLRVFSEVAQICQKIGNSGLMEGCMNSVQAFNWGLVDTNLDKLIKACLILAYTFFSIADFEKMDQELKAAIKLIRDGGPLTTAKNLYPLARLIAKSAKSENIKSQFKNFEIEPFIKQALADLKNSSSQKVTTKDRAEAYLSIARIYQEGVLDDPTMKEQILGYAVEEIQKLPGSSNEDIDNKINLLIELVNFYEQDPDAAQLLMKALENLYHQCPPSANGSSADIFWDKIGLGRKILKTYHTMGLKEEVKRFSGFYLSDLSIQNPQETVKDEPGIDKIFHLVTDAMIHHVLDFDGIALSQLAAQRLQAAETLLPQLTSSIEYEYALKNIARGYLKVNRQKSLQFLEKHENRQANGRLKAAAIKATTTIIGTGALYFYPRYPQAGLCLLAGLPVVHMFLKEDF